MGIVGGENDGEEEEKKTTFSSCVVGEWDWGALKLEKEWGTRYC